MKLTESLLLLSTLAGCASAPMHADVHEADAVSFAPSRDLSEPLPLVPGDELINQGPPPPSGPRPPARPLWMPGQPLMQGFIGVSEYSDVERSGGGTPDVDGDDGDVGEMPVLGGGAQFKLGGERLDYGLEGLFSFGGRANAEAFVVGGGGAAVAIDVDLLIFDFYGGPFVSTFLGDKLRLYAGAGPILEWADYEQENNLFHDHGSGFGYGWYARTGLEFVLPSRTLLGFGARWSDTEVDLDGGLGDLDVNGFQLLFTVSRGI